MPMEELNIDLASYEDQFQAVLKQTLEKTASLPNRKNTPPVGVYTTPDEDQLITYLETNYWLNGGYPSFGELLEFYPEDYLRQLIFKLSERLSLRGLPKYVLPPAKDDPIFNRELTNFDPRFVMACNIVTNVTDKRTKAAKLNEVNVSMAEWDGWLTNNENYQYYQRLVEIKWNQVDETAKLQVIRNIENGSLSDIKYYHEFTGKFTPQAQIQVNMGIVIARVIETLTRFVEPAKLEEIASALTSETLFQPAEAIEVQAPWELNP